jgi:flavin reductase (DIM6/NTAB) family NADH-FMN oxidoreductase RutF
MVSPDYRVRRVHGATVNKLGHAVFSGRARVAPLATTGAARPSRRFDTASPNFDNSGFATMDVRTRKKTLRMLSNGVYVLSSRCEDQYGAATVTWVSQVSFKPPLIMAAVRPDSNVFRCLSRSGTAVLHIVGDDQQEIARRFFFPTDAGAGRINGEPFAEGTTSAPVFPRLPAHIECRVERIVDGYGDHALVILGVVDAACNDDRVRPLTIAATPWTYGG